MAKFALVENGEIVNMDHVVKITDFPNPENRAPYIQLELDNGKNVSVSGSEMEDIKRYIFQNSVK